MVPVWLFRRIPRCRTHRDVAERASAVNLLQAAYTHPDSSPCISFRHRLSSEPPTIVEDNDFWSAGVVTATSSSFSHRRYSSWTASSTSSNLHVKAIRTTATFCSSTASCSLPAALDLFSGLFCNWLPSKGPSCNMTALIY